MQRSKFFWNSISDSTESNVDSEESLESVANLDCDGMQGMEETNQEELVDD